MQSLYFRESISINNHNVSCYYLLFSISGPTVDIVYSLQVAQKSENKWSFLNSTVIRFYLKFTLKIYVD